MSDRVIGPLWEARTPLTDGFRQVQPLRPPPLPPKLPSRWPLSIPPSLTSATLSCLSPRRKVHLYIAIGRGLGAVGATDVMEAQHASIAVMTEDLSKVVSAAREDDDVRAYTQYLLPLLHGLYALVRAHLESEDDVTSRSSTRTLANRKSLCLSITSDASQRRDAKMR